MDQIFPTKACLPSTFKYTAGFENSGCFYPGRIAVKSRAEIMRQRFVCAARLQTPLLLLLHYFEVIFLLHILIMDSESKFGLEKYILSNDEHSLRNNPNSFGREEAAALNFLAN